MADIPFVPARWYTNIPEGQNRGIWFVVIHDMEASENLSTAENCANYMHTTDRKVSAHLCSDADSTIRCVDDSDVAYACVDGNSHGLQYEMAGFANQTTEQWADDYSQKMLREQVAPNVAAWCQKYSIPVRFLTAEMIVNYRRKNQPYMGITTHAEHNRAMRLIAGNKSQYSHTDPGKNFPMNDFLMMVNSIVNPAPTPVPPDPTPPTPHPPSEAILKDMPRVQLGSTGNAVVTMQSMLVQRGYMSDKPANRDGVFGNGTDGALRRYQSDKGLVVDGKCWEQTWARLGYN